MKKNRNMNTMSELVPNSGISFLPLLLKLGIV